VKLLSDGANARISKITNAIPCLSYNQLFVQQFLKGIYVLSGRRICGYDLLEDFAFSLILE
jgi:hypothetical protein